MCLFAIIDVDEEVMIGISGNRATGRPSSMAGMRS
jgi:hypothetical protein